MEMTDMYKIIINVIIPTLSNLLSNQYLDVKFFYLFS